MDSSLAPNGLAALNATRRRRRNALIGASRSRHYPNGAPPQRPYALGPRPAAPSGSASPSAAAGMARELSMAERRRPLYRPDALHTQRGGALAAAGGGSALNASLMTNRGVFGSTSARPTASLPVRPQDNVLPLAAAY